jgi:hypothetical protein
MTSSDRRFTRLEFGLGNPRKRSKLGQDGEDDEDDRPNVIASKTINSQTERDAALTKFTSGSPSPRQLTKIPTRYGSAEIGRLHLPQNQDPWKKFKPLLHVRQGCPAIMARSIPPDWQLYAVRSISTEKDKHLHAIQQLGLCPGRGVDWVQEIFDWSGKLFIVTKYVKLSLSQIITSQDRPTEGHIAFIAHVVSSGPRVS